MAIRTLQHDKAATNPYNRSGSQVVQFEPDPQPANREKAPFLSRSIS
jgi:hypothetical protein